jgi:uncharacterized membrane protein YphA (DoxX/SURF4 family)
METLKPASSRDWAELAATLGRWLLGGLFVYMGLRKALEPFRFLELVHAYGMVGNPYLLNAIAAALPWFETFCGLLLLAGVAVRGTALMLILMLVPFTLLILQRAFAIAAAKNISFWIVKFDCGCGAGEVIIWQKMIENSLLILLACWLLSGHGRRLAARFALMPEAEATIGNL